MCSAPTLEAGITSRFQQSDHSLSLSEKQSEVSRRLHVGVPAPIITHSAPFDHGPSHRHFVVAASEKHGVVHPLLDQCLFCHLPYKHVISIYHV